MGFINTGRVLSGTPAGDFRYLQYDIIQSLHLWVGPDGQVRADGRADRHLAWDEQWRLDVDPFSKYITAVRRDGRRRTVVVASDRNNLGQMCVASDGALLIADAATRAIYRLEASQVRGALAGKVAFRVPIESTPR